MSELEINTPTNQTPDAVKAKPVVESDDDNKEPIEQKVAVDS
jgi:hypothetical protein